MICTIVGAMREPALTIPQSSFVIAADGGYAQLMEKGIEPDLVVGDFDSLGYVPQAKALVQHPVRKDDTDMMLAAREGLRRGYRQFLLYGGIGGRLDHTIANIQTLAFLLENGARGVLFGEGTAVTLLQNETVCLPRQNSGGVSVFSFGASAQGVTERGLSYDAEDLCVRNTFPIGVSNSFCGRAAQIGVQSGILLLLWEANAQQAIRFLTRPDES